MDFAVLADHKVKIQGKKGRQVTESCQRAVKAVEYGDGDTNCN